MISDNAKIGTGLLGLGIAFLFLGILFFFDSAMLALGDILFLSGLTLTIGEYSWISPASIFIFSLQSTFIRYDTPFSQVQAARCDSSLDRIGFVVSFHFLAVCCW